MSPNSMQAIIDGIIAREGSKFTNVKGDRGGPTKFGITLDTLSKWRNIKCVSADVEELNEDEARAIYTAMFITTPRFNLINDDGLATLLIDWGVMSGPAAAVKGLQTVLSAHGTPLKIDGVLGSKTVEAANTFQQGSRVLRNWIVDAKLAFHIDDVSKNPDQLQFLRGWFNRTISFRSN